MFTVYVFSLHMSKYLFELRVCVLYECSVPESLKVMLTFAQCRAKNMFLPQSQVRGKITDPSRQLRHYENCTMGTKI